MSINEVGEGLACMIMQGAAGSNTEELMPGQGSKSSFLDGQQYRNTQSNFYHRHMPQCAPTTRLVLCQAWRRQDEEKQTWP